MIREAVGANWCCAGSVFTGAATGAFSSATVLAAKTGVLEGRAEVRGKKRAEVGFMGVLAGEDEGSIASKLDWELDRDRVEGEDGLPGLQAESPEELES